MRQRRFELVIALISAIICYLGEYYLKESFVKAVARHTIVWHALNILWLLSMVGIGYWGLNGHEIKWVKSLWLLINFGLLLVLFLNKLLWHFWQHLFIPMETSTFIRTPFFFLMMAYLPRWAMRSRR